MGLLLQKNTLTIAGSAFDLLGLNDTGATTDQEANQLIAFYGPVSGRLAFIGLGSSTDDLFEMVTSYAAGEIAFSTAAGVEAMRIDTSQNVGIGLTDPADPLQVRTDSGGEAIAIEENSGDEQWELGVDSDGDLNFQDSGSTVITFEDGGFVGIGVENPVGTLHLAGIQALIHERNSDNSGGPDFLFRKSRGTTSSPTAVQENDNLFAITSTPHDGTNFVNNAVGIRAQVDAPVSSNNVAGRLLFLTSPEGSNTLTERMRIDNAGNVGIGTTSPLDSLVVIGNVRISVSLNATSINVTNLEVHDNAVIEGKLDIGQPGVSGGLDIGEGGSYTKNHSGTIIVQVFTYDASAASGSRFTEFTDLDASNTMLADVGDRLYIGSDELFWATRFEISTAIGDSQLVMRFYDGSLSPANLSNMTHMGILKDSATTLGTNIWNQTAEKEYTTWDHDIQDDWIRGNNVPDLIPNADGNKYWIIFEVPTAGITNAPVFTEIKVRGTDFDIVSGLSHVVYWGNARLGIHERIPLNVVKSPGGTGTTNIDIDSAHQQTVFDFNGAGDLVSFFWIIPECVDTSSKIEVELDWSANAADTFDFTLSASSLLNNTVIGSSVTPDFQRSFSLISSAANTMRIEEPITPDGISIQNLTATDMISIELERTDATNAMYPFAITIHYLQWCEGNLATEEA